MIGFKNVWANIFALLLTIFAATLIYIVLDKEKLLIVGGITISVCITGILVSLLNKEKEAVKKEIDKKANTTELIMVDKKIDQHIIDNHESFNSLFGLMQDMKKTLDDFILEFAKRRIK